VWGGHEVVDLALGRLALHYTEENPDEVVAALDDKAEDKIFYQLYIVDIYFNKSILLYEMLVGRLATEKRLQLSV
jgi:hypothetical protein